jgi:cell division protein FtsL
MTMMMMATMMMTMTMMMMIMIILDFNREIQELKQGEIYKYLGIEERLHKEIKNDMEMRE